MSSNADVVASARRWLGTRFHHQGRLKRTESHHGGVDCLGLLVGVAEELDIRLPDGAPAIILDRTDYTHHPDTEYLKAQLMRVLETIPHDGISPGDILLLNIDASPQHLGIVSDLNPGLGIIHAYAPARAVVEHVLDSGWRQRIVAAYRLP